jgi:NAD(P)-dependent dehydrogenase (short-subunit alcohol dehydrogenase family)
MTLLKDKIALVTGASRGAGRGIALELGAAGATVYVTGRSRKDGVVTSKTSAPLPLTVDETARLVTEAGGRGIPVYCDHTRDDEVKAVFDQIEREGGRLDLLVNNAWGGYEGYYDDAPFDSPFWQQPMWRLDRMYTSGLRSHFLSSQFGARLMLLAGQGLIVNITTYMKSGNEVNVSPVYDIVKSAINRMTVVMGEELRPHGITAVALAPGWMRTEDMLGGFNTDEAHYQETGLNGKTETPHYVGRAVVALASDANLMQQTGRTLLVGKLAKVYGFTDTDGTQPDFYPDVA